MAMTTLRKYLVLQEVGLAAVSLALFYSTEKRAFVFTSSERIIALIYPKFK